MLDVKTLRAAKDVQGLITVLTHEWEYESYSRKEAAKALGELGDPEAIEPLISGLEDVDPTIQRTAKEALVKIGSRVTPALIRTLQDKNISARAAAAEILGKLGESRAVGPITKLLWGETNWSVKMAAIVALGLIGDRRSIKPLAKVMDRDPEWSFREAAAEALGNIGDREAVRRLERALNDPHQFVQRAAKDAIDRLLHRR